MLVALMIGNMTNTSHAQQLHVAEGQTVLFGKDTVGDGTVGGKFMWQPWKGGALRAGYLNYDGSVGNGTTFWDPDSVAWASIALGNNTRATSTGSVSIGVRTRANNFAAVAMGHLSTCNGNSAFSLGYYNRTNSFLSIGLGPGNVGRGNPYVWVETDPILEVGNSLDTTNRHNALTILKNGRVGIETDLPQASLHIKQLSSFAEGGIRLEYNSDSDHWQNWIDGANDYNFAFNGSLKAYIQDNDGTYVTTSDQRLKDNIVPLEEVLPRVKLLKPSSYTFKDAATVNRSIGLIAQEVEPLFPELVIEKDGILGINYMGFVTVALQSIQELAMQNELLQEKINYLQDQVAKVHKR